MADVKISELTAASSLAETDLLPGVLNPSTTPISRKLTVKQLLDVRLNYSIAPAGDFTLSTATGVQSAFPTTGDVFTLVAATTYEFEGMYVISKSGTTCTTAMAFALGGGASVTSILYHALAHSAAANTTTTAQDVVYVDTVSSTVINATNAANTIIKFKGLIRMNVGGTVTPQINFSASPTTPLMKANSYIKFTPIGTNTENVKGVVA